MTFKLTAEPHDGRVDLLCTDLPDKTKRIRWRRDGTVIATTDAVALADEDVVNGQPYVYVAVALDRRGNRLDSSNAASATPKAAGLFLPALVGHGKGVTGGGSAIPSKIATYAQFKEAVLDSGDRVLVGDRQWLKGPAEAYKVGNGDLTIIDISLELAAPVFVGLNTRLHGCRFQPGEVDGDADGLTVNGQGSAGSVEGFAATNCWFCGGPDMGGGAILGECFHVTLQRCVFGPGLQQSNVHLGNVGDFRNHNRILNFTTFGEHADGPWGRFQTLYESLIWGGEDRNPDIKYVQDFDGLRNLTYNHNEAPAGNNRGANWMFNRVRSGPQTVAARAKQTWDGQVKPGEVPFPLSIYTEGNVADGFPAKESFADGTKRTTPYGTLSVPRPTAAPEVDELLAFVGPTTGRNAQEQRLLDHVRNRTSDGYYTGEGLGTPNLAWPVNP